MFGPPLDVGLTQFNQRLKLLPLGESDPVLMVSWLNDPEVMAQLNPDWKPTNLENEKDTQAAFLLDPSAIHWAIFADSNPIGVAWINEIDWTKASGSMGLMIGDKSYWGQGVGTWIGQTICKYAFEQEKFLKLHIAFTRTNPGSHKIAKRLGFSLKEGMAHFTEGKDYPGFDGILTKADWLHSKEMDKTE